LKSTHSLPFGPQLGVTLFSSADSTALQTPGTGPRHRLKPKHRWFSHMPAWHFWEWVGTEGLFAENRPAVIFTGDSSGGGLPGRPGFERVQDARHFCAQNLWINAADAEDNAHANHAGLILLHGAWMSKPSSGTQFLQQTTRRQA
jgi:hypothetical protein